MQETFTVEGEFLFRDVVPARGKPYIHRCHIYVLRDVAHAADELTDGFTLEEVHAHLQVHPWTQIAVALAFLKERGVIVRTSDRKHRAASKDCYLDATAEFCVLAEFCAADIKRRDLDRTNRAAEISDATYERIDATI